MPLSFKEQQYHPIRWFDKLSTYIADSFDEIDPDKVTNAELDQWKADATDRFIESMSGLIHTSNFPYPSKEGWNEYVDELFDIILGFYDFGENIFHIRPELTQMLQNTDVGNVRIDDIKLPYESFYLHFGNNGIKLWGDFHLDGTYIKELSISERDPVIGFLLIASKSPSVYLKNSHPKVVFENEAHLFHTMAYHETEVETVNENVSWNFSGDFIGSDLKKDSHTIWFRYMNEVNALVINSLLFLTSRPEDVVEGFSETTPSSLVEKYDRAILIGDNKLRERAESKIKSAGHKRIKFVGNNISKSYRSIGIGNSPRTHWRRGHWRQQSIGKDLKKTKLIWIEPTLVAKGNSKDLEIKHIYDVDE